MDTNTEISTFDQALSQVSQLERAAAKRVVEWYGGVYSMARRLGVTNSTIRHCLSRGKLGRYVAYLVDQDPDSPFTLPELRHDHAKIGKDYTPRRPGPKIKKEFTNPDKSQ